MITGRGHFSWRSGFALFRGDIFEPRSGQQVGVSHERKGGRTFQVENMGVQRPGGGSVPGVFENQGGQQGSSSGNKRKRESDEVGEVGGAQICQASFAVAGL